MKSAIVVGVVVAIVAIILAVGAGDPTGPNAFVIIGLSQGAVFGLVALGLVLVYKGSRVFNFAQGEFGTIAAFLVFVMVEQRFPTKVPYVAAAVIAIALTVLVGLIMERVVVRPLLNSPRVILLVATIAFALLAIWVEVLAFLPEAKALPPMVSSVFGRESFELFAFTLEPQRMLILLVMGGLAAGLAYFFSKTDLGLAVLAISQDSFATRVVGIGVERMSRFIWGSAAFLGAVAGVLYVPLTVLTPGAMTTGILIPAFTGAVIGGMTSLPGAFVGGIIVGLIGSLSNWAGGHYFIGEGVQAKLLGDIVKGAPDVAVVLALLLVLLARPQGLLGREA